MVEAALALLGLVLSAFFSGSEIAFLQANPVQLAVWREHGQKPAEHTEHLLADPDRYLTRHSPYQTAGVQRTRYP